MIRVFLYLGVFEEDETRVFERCKFPGSRTILFFLKGVVLSVHEEGYMPICIREEMEMKLQIKVFFNTYSFYIVFM